ncbi:MAG: ATP-binding protein [Pirellula sp.]|nr:ATP-binding protein [Pirellula sp.]
MKFIGRINELSNLEAIKRDKESSLIVIYGRRRVGKTTLIERAFGDRRLLKFEGVEGKSDAFQISQFVATLRKHFQQSTVQHATPTTWTEAFELLSNCVNKGKWTIYFEELQWMANYRSDLISELKPIWDNLLRRNPSLILVLCGSSPSFFLSEVIRSRSLHNRSSLDLRLDEFPILEAAEFLGKPTINTLFDAYLSVGGIPIYLQRLTSGSVYQSLCEHSFRKNGFFTDEFDKVFVSSFGTHPVYRQIVAYLGRNSNATREQIAKAVGVSSGGTLSSMLIDLEECGFIKRIVPLDKPMQSLLGYYQIRDSYLHFYFRFIEPQKTAIQNGDFQRQPQRAMDTRTFRQWLGGAFERFCRDQAFSIAELLGFSAVQFKVGTFFRRGNVTEFGTQIDLLFDRADKVHTVCEVKYQDAPIGIDVIEDVERKITSLPLSRGRSVQKVLITSSPITKGLQERAYFDRVLSLEDLLSRPLPARIRR